MKTEARPVARGIFWGSGKPPFFGEPLFCQRTPLAKIKPIVIYYRLARHFLHCLFLAFEPFPYLMLNIV